MNSIVSFKNVIKEYNGVTLLDNISFTINRGDIYGLIGENGAGKTTILKLIVNLVKASKGKITVFGEDINNNSYKYLKDIGSLIEEISYYKKLTLWENFNIHCEYLGFYDKSLMKEILKKVGLTSKEKLKIKDLSLGEKQRLSIAFALVTNPELIILDEPTNGLDPVATVKLRETLLTVNKEFNTTIVISSHILQELERLVNRVAFIRKGKIIYEGLLEDIKEKSSIFIEVEIEEAERALVVLERKLKLRKIRLVDSTKIRIYEGFSERNTILRELVNSNISVLSFNLIKSSLEDYFINNVEEDIRND